MTAARSGQALLERALPRAAEIVADVRLRGDEALLEWTERLDEQQPASLCVPAAEIARAVLDEPARSALRRLARAVETFHRAQRPADISLETIPGIQAERRFVPLCSVGLYVPGGRAAYPSSLVMTDVPARIAGVERIAVVSPRPSPALLATAHELGVGEIYAAGGAAAIAALAYGTETIPAVDKGFRPGKAC